MRISAPAWATINTVDRKDLRPDTLTVAHSHGNDNIAAKCPTLIATRKPIIDWYELCLSVFWHFFLLSSNSDLRQIWRLNFGGHRKKQGISIPKLL